MSQSYMLWYFALMCLISVVQVKLVNGLACNWGTQSTHPLQANIVVQLLRDNGFDKVKLFEADPLALKALGKSGIQVMVGIPNDMLASLASNLQNAVNWVQQNVSNYISRHKVDIRYVAVGNEPFLKTYKDKFVHTTFPALKNVKAALNKAGLGKRVKVTTPLNADVYQSENGLPSAGDFRSDIRDLMISIIKFLSDNNSPLTINIYPFLSLYADPDFPIDFAFFNGTSKPVIDGSISYSNVFEANFDTLISALEKNGFSSMPVIIGEVGWPTDGDSHANVEYARKFNQGLINRILQGQGTPKRRTPPEVYLFSLIDEDAKSVEPGNFERHWGIFNYDGTIKFQMKMGQGKPLKAAKGVKYLSRQWCVMSPQASPSDPNLPGAIAYACSYADCTSLGYGSSCGALDVKANASYAFNMYYQTLDQRQGACSLSNLSVVTNLDPSQGSCRYEIMIDLGKHETASTSLGTRKQISILVFVFVFIVWALCGA